MAKKTRQKSSSAHSSSTAKGRSPKSTNSRKPLPAQVKSATARAQRAAPGTRLRLAKSPAAAQVQHAPPPAPARKPGYYEALAMYEAGVRSLQRHDYEGAAAQFRTIIERYPEERELQERSQLYLRVCERETAKRPASPQTPQERVYAATVALNAGDAAGALEHLRRALADAPDSDHAHYIMSVALAAKGDAPAALQHLRQAIALNSDNRPFARQDPDLESLRSVEGFWDLVEEQAGQIRAKPRKRR